MRKTWWRRARRRGRLVRFPRTKDLPRSGVCHSFASNLYRRGPGDVLDSGVSWGTVDLPRGRVNGNGGVCGSRQVIWQRWVWMKLGVMLPGGWWVSCSLKRSGRLTLFKDVLCKVGFCFASSKVSCSIASFGLYGCYSTPSSCA